MRRHIISFFLGFAVACCLFILIVLPRHGREKYDYGRKHGEIMTKLDLLQRIPKALGDDYRGSDGYNTFFEVKADAAVVVERNGVKHSGRMWLDGSKDALRKVERRLL
jgi:hypothetical protein